MAKKNQLFDMPPYAVEKRLSKLGADLRTARLRRQLTIPAVAEKIGTGVRAVAEAEKGRASTGVGVYVALLWAYGLLDQMEDLADPVRDAEGQRLELSRQKSRARSGRTMRKVIDDDF